MNDNGNSCFRLYILKLLLKAICLTNFPSRRKLQKVRETVSDAEQRDII